MVLIIEVNCYLLCSGYEVCNWEELLVLVCWFEGVEVLCVNYLVVILYSVEQFVKEGLLIGVEWGIVGCIYIVELDEVLMVLIMMMCNVLGVEEGGFGVLLDCEVYWCVVEFWENNVNWWL